MAEFQATVDDEQAVKPDLDDGSGTSRRRFLARLTGAVAAVGAVLAGWPLFRSLVPNVLYEPPRRFKVGLPERFQEGVTFLDEHRLYLIREADSFHAISGICSHLGCTVKFSPFSTVEDRTVRKHTFRALGEFHCPCHGSKFHGEGTNYAGPAPRPLKWYRLDVSSASGELVIDLSKEVGRDFRLVV
ncbi:MAG: Rieske 2Fe-2S domain-containing protein [bacterium]|nr:Rieske 2Fe-2S domain-containing protein [bacterium]